MSGFIAESVLVEDFSSKFSGKENSHSLPPHSQSPFCSKAGISIFLYFKYLPVYSTENTSTRPYPSTVTMTSFLKNRPHPIECHQTCTLSFSSNIFCMTLHELLR